MKIEKWDFKKNGYHPHEPGLRKKLTTMGFEKVRLQECKPGTEINMKNVSDKDYAMAILAGRIFLQGGESTEALHQGDIVVIPPATDYRFKASGNVNSKVLQAR